MRSKMNTQKTTTSIVSKFISIADAHIQSSAKLATFSGFAIAAFGMLAIISPMFSGLAATSFISVLMAAGGVTVMFYSFKAEKKRTTVFQLLFGLLTLLAGVALFTMPIENLFLITVLLFGYLTIDGLFSLYYAFKLRSEKGWGWVLLSSLCSLALAGIIAYQWPISAFYSVGTIVGVRLVIAGWTTAMVGFSASYNSDKLKDKLNTEVQEKQQKNDNNSNLLTS
ncbi:hypothetical protein D6089_06690 [Vibrio vulnificus]|nr:hypothetical protein [Vibrio vulnificus]RZP56838.1 hypothetical protein D8T48_11435 [Vibrio vulnificus]